MIKNYFKKVWAIFTSPSDFFRGLATAEKGTPLAYPLAFALVTHWIGSALEYLWHLLVGGFFGSYLNQVIEIAGDVAEVDHPGRGAALTEMRDRVLSWFWGAGPVIADPFLTLIGVLFTSFFVFVGAKLLVPSGKRGVSATFDSALRIVCYGMTPSLLAALPLFGTLLSMLCTALVTIVGAREVYRVSTPRAVGIALFPKLLFLGVLMAFAGLVFLLILKAVTSVI